jgi:16S rRNA (guanine527-N7)-methyltransferase
MSLDDLIGIASDNGLALTDGQRQLLLTFAELLRDWNSKINLISRKDEENILERHILHSLTIAMPTVCDFDLAGKRVIDIGTGGGLPGIPLKITVSTTHVTLVDSIQKKIGAVSDMIAKLGLTDAEAVAIRAEELGKQPKHKHSYDAVVSRAVAPLEELVTWTRDLRKPGAPLFSLKGGDLSEEINRAERIKGVRRVEAKPLTLIGYDEFVKEEKKIVRVDFHQT